MIILCDFMKYSTPVCMHQNLHCTVMSEPDSRWGRLQKHLSWAKLDISAQEATTDDDGADGECDDDYCCDYSAVVVDAVLVR